MASSWADSWSTSWLDSWGATGAVVDVDVDTPTGGFLSPSYAYARYKSDKERREERIRLGIIPPDVKPELVEAIQEAAKDSTFLKEAKKLGRKSKRRAKEIESIIAELRAAQEEEERRYLLQLAIDDREELEQLLADEQRRRNNNAAIVILMLSER